MVINVDEDMVEAAERLERVEQLAADYRAHLPAGRPLGTEDLYDSAGLWR